MSGQMASAVKCHPTAFKVADMDFLSSVASLMVFLLSIARKCVLTIPAIVYVDIVLDDTTRKRIGVVLFLMRIHILTICKPSNTRFNTANKRLFWSVTYLMTDIIVNEFKAAPTTYRATDIRFVSCVLSAIPSADK